MADLHIVAGLDDGYYWTRAGSGGWEPAELRTIDGHVWDGKEWVPGRIRQWWCIGWDMAADVDEVGPRLEPPSGDPLQLPSRSGNQAVRRV